MATESGKCHQLQRPHPEKICHVCSTAACINTESHWFSSEFDIGFSLETGYLCVSLPGSICCSLIYSARRFFGVIRPQRFLGLFAWVWMANLGLCWPAAPELGGSLHQFESGFCCDICDKTAKRDSRALLESENNVNLKPNAFILRASRHPSVYVKHRFCYVSLNI